MLAVLTALGASVMYAMASVLQHKGAAEQPPDKSMRLGLLFGLIRHPWWLLGLLCDVAGFGLQFVALGHGPIVVVQPLLVCGLLFALPIGAALAGRRLGAVDWVSALMVCAGLGVFLALANPAAGRPDTDGRTWILLLCLVAGVAAILIVFSRGRDARRRSFLLSLGAGVIYGTAAALTKTTSHLANDGVLNLFTHWQPYALALVGLAGMLLGQSAFQAGALDVSLPAMSVADPIVSITIGALVFGEAISRGSLHLAVELTALLVMSAGVIILARSEAAGSAQPDDQQRQAGLSHPPVAGATRAAPAVVAEPPSGQE